MKLEIFSNVLFALVFVVSAGCESWDANAGEREQSKPEKAVKPRATVVETVMLKNEEFASQVQVTGKALALREGYLSLSVPGRIDKISVKLGDRVKKGQVLARLDRQGYELGVQQAQAALDGANAATDQLTTELSRVEQLLSEGAAPSAAKDDLMAKDKGAKAQSRMATAALAQAQKALKDSVLRAPFDGVITDILKEVGEQAPAMPPTMLMKIVDTSELDVQVFVPEASSRFVKEGVHAAVTVDSANVTTQGEVVFVSNAILQGTRTFEVRIRIANPDDKIKAGAFARVRLAEESRQDAILIPVSTLSRDEKDVPYVFVADKGRAKRITVALGSPEGDRVLVRSGLTAGQKVITTDIANLSDGQPIVEAE
jgi:RND family efflux transporter MFP subunit